MELKITGLADLQQELNRLKDKVERRVTRRALQAAAKPIRDAMERMAPMAEGGPTYPELGHLKDHIIITTRISKTGGAVAKIGPDDDHFWGNFIEYGTPTVPADPFIRPAFDQHKEEAFDILVKEIASGIEREAGK